MSDEKDKKRKLCVMADDRTSASFKTIQTVVRVQGYKNRHDQELVLHLQFTAAAIALLVVVELSHTASFCSCFVATFLRSLCDTATLTDGHHGLLYTTHIRASAESALKSFLSGGVGGVCVVLVGHPLDLIKVCEECVARIRPRRTTRSSGCGSNMVFQTSEVQVSLLVDEQVLIICRVSFRPAPSLFNLRRTRIH